MILLELAIEKRHVSSREVYSHLGYQGALLEFSAFENDSVSIWHPNCSKTPPPVTSNDRNDLKSIIAPVDTEIVQIQSKFGKTLRSVQGSDRTGIQMVRCGQTLFVDR